MKYRKISKYKYQLMDREEFKVDLPDIFEGTTQALSYLGLKDGVLSIEKWYAWDGSSIPLKKTLRFLSLGLYDADKHCKTASLVHDALCQLIREELLGKKYKEEVDGIYKYMCLMGGMSEWQADLRYWALRKFGDPFIQKRENPKGQIFEE